MITPEGANVPGILCTDKDKMFREFIVTQLSHETTLEPRTK